MATKTIFNEYLYGDLLAPAPGYSTDFACGMTYSLSFEALLTAYLAFGMQGETDGLADDSKQLLLEAITKSSDKVVMFCNKGNIAVPRTIRKEFSLMEDNIFEVFDKNNIRANFHPKLWLIREVSDNNSNDILLKLIVTSRNMSYSDHLDCVACLRGKVVSNPPDVSKHRQLANFIREIAEASNIGKRRKSDVLRLAADVERIERFDVDPPFDDYDFFPYLFNKDFGHGDISDYLVGNESIIVSPFIDKTTIGRLAPDDNSRRCLITRKEYVDDFIFNRFAERGGVYITLDDLASRRMDLHAKMYYVWKNRDEQYLFLGSANATNAAFSRNGEFLLRLKYRHGNKHAADFLSSFYEADSSDSKFMPMNEPVATPPEPAKWDEAESAMKVFMCADDLKAEIKPQSGEGYMVSVTSAAVSSHMAELFIAPLQRPELKQLWTGKAIFENMAMAELSEFYLLSATDADNVSHHTVIKIATIGMPAERDSRIYGNLIKSDKDFYRFIELLLTDAPAHFIANELIQHSDADSGGHSDKNGFSCQGLYETLLRAAATRPAQIRALEQLMTKLGREVVPKSFSHIYKQLITAISRH